MPLEGSLFGKLLDVSIQLLKLITGPYEGVICVGYSVGDCPCHRDEELLPVDHHRTELHLDGKRFGIGEKFLDRPYTTEPFSFQ